METKKIGIVTLNGYENYGNRLQNYALKKIIERQGFEVETLILCLPEDTESGGKRVVLKLKKLVGLAPREVWKRIVGKIKKRKLYAQNQEIYDRRRNSFRSFSEVYLNENKYKVNEYGNNSWTNQFHCIVTGSDQVWNPINMERLHLLFLTFIEKDKRISYAASFGRSTIDEKDRNQFREWIDGIRTLSVREEAGAKIINELTGREAKVLVDPTLLLTADEWLGLVEFNEIQEAKPYVLTYFLGEIPEENQRYFEYVAQKEDMDLVSLLDITNDKIYAAGPDAFIKYINSAKLFFTDSFHGVVFAAMMGTPFVVYRRRENSASMYSRIETILRKLGMEDRAAEQVEEEHLLSMDFSQVHLILEDERQQSMDYLKNAFLAFDERE